MQFEILNVTTEDNGKVKAYQDSIINERKRIIDALKELENFIHAEREFGPVPTISKLTLSKQAEVMRNYANILQELIDNF